MKFTMLSATGLMCVSLCLFSPAEAADAVSVSACFRQDGRIFEAPMATVPSGQIATIQFDDAVVLTICPTTQQDGTTVIASTLTTDTDAGAPVIVTLPVAIVSTGESTTVLAREGDVWFTASLGK